MNIDIQFEESNQSIDVDFGEIQIIGGSENIAVIEPLSVTENGTYTAHGDVDGYSPVYVNVPIPDGYIQPQGTIEITENGEYVVTEYANAIVNVEEAKEEQEKTVDITENGTTEVTPDDGKVLSKVTVNVDVEKGITPSGTLEITENGEYDVTEYASAKVDVESGGNSYEVINAIINGTIKEFYTEETFPYNGTSTKKFGTLFNDCPSLIKWAMPNYNVGYDGYMFRYCSKLTYIDLGKPTSIAATIFYGRHIIGLDIVIRAENPPALSGMFAGSNYDETTSIYVPKNSIEAYKTATNWTAYSDNFKAIEDYPEITGGII